MCRSSPYKLALFNVVTISCGKDYAMALDTKNEVYMWGDKIDAFLSRASINSAEIPFQF